MDGFQAARAIRAFEKQTQIPPTVLIALTCLGSAEAKLEAESCGMDLFLTKPVKPREITKILENVRGIVEENHRNMDWKIADKDAVECNAQLIDAMKMAKLPQEDEVELLEVVQDANEPSSIATSVRL
jgi:CheY-like chemotaxis protein